jgi:hypothetical protein
VQMPPRRKDKQKVVTAAQSASSPAVVNKPILHVSKIN